MTLYFAEGSSFHRKVTVQPNGCNEVAKVYCYDGISISVSVVLWQNYWISMTFNGKSKQKELITLNGLTVTADLPAALTHPPHNYGIDYAPPFAQLLDCAT